MSMKLENWLPTFSSKLVKILKDLSLEIEAYKKELSSVEEPHKIKLLRSSFKAVTNSVTALLVKNGSVEEPHKINMLRNSFRALTKFGHKIKLLRSSLELVTMVTSSIPATNMVLKNFFSKPTLPLLMVIKPSIFRELLKKE